MRLRNVSSSPTSGNMQPSLAPVTAPGPALGSVPMAFNTQGLPAAYPNFSTSHPPLPVAMIRPPSRTAIPPLSSMPMAVDPPANIHVNFSSVRPPNPAAMKRPPPAPETYYVVTAGEKVGIFNDSDDLDLFRLPYLPYFYMTRFDNWDMAHRFYAGRYAAKEVFLITDNPVAPTATSGPLGTSGPAAQTSGLRTEPATAFATGNATSVAANQPAHLAVAPVQPTVAVSAAQFLGLNTLASVASAALSVPATVPVSTASSVLSKILPYVDSLQSPFGRPTNPILVSDDFPTPKLVPVPPPPPPVAAGPVPSGAVASGAGASRPGASGLVSRHRKSILLARKSPSAGKSKGKAFILTKKSTATTKIRRAAKAKGKARGPGTDEEVYVYGTEDDSNELPGPSYSTASRTLAQPRIAPLVYNVPMVTITAPTPAAPVVATASAPAQSTSDERYNPFHHSPLSGFVKKNSLTTPTRASKPTVSDSPATYEQILQRAIETPKSVTIETPKSLTTETPKSLATETPKSLATKTPKSLATETPKSVASLKRLALIQQAIREMNSPAAAPATPSFGTPVTPAFRALATPTIPTPATPAVLTTPATPSFSTPATRFAAIQHGFAATSFAVSRTTASAVANTPVTAHTHFSTPETEYGLSSDLDIDFLNAAAPLLDQVYTHPAITKPAV